MNETSIDRSADPTLSRPSPGGQGRSITPRTGKPKFLLIGPLPPPYIGPAIATERLLKSELLRKAFDIQFLDTSDKGGLDDIGQLSMRNIGVALQHGMQCWGLLLRERPDIVYIPIARGLWGFVRDLLFLVPARMARARVLVHLRAGRFDIRHDYGRMGRFIARIGLRCATRGIVLGETVRDVYGDNIPSDLISVVPNGIDLERWDAPNGSSKRATNRFHITYLANLYEDKGAHVMLAALPRIVRDVPDVMVTFAGQPSDRAFYERCLAYVREHGLDGHVEFVGPVDEAGKKRLLFDTDLAAFVPVKPEGLPWVVLEAMASGLPVVGTPQGTMKEVIVEGETGFIVRQDDPDELADRVVRLARDPDLRRRLGAAGRKRIETVYAEPATHQRLVEVALEALAGDTRRH